MSVLLIIGSWTCRKSCTSWSTHPNHGWKLGSNHKLWFLLLYYILLNPFFFILEILFFSIFIFSLNFIFIQSYLFIFVLVVPYSVVLIFLVMVGIDVGYQFYSRAEMVAVGFHSHWLNGIDYMGQSYAKAVMKFLAMLYLFICSLLWNIIDHKL